MAATAATTTPGEPEWQVDAAEPEEHSYDYDLIVIGGGSGGLACAKEAAVLGKKVALLDFVKPSPQGTAWGLGGTCVNVGCIPKKLMHTAALLGEHLRDAGDYGWEVPERSTVRHDWAKMVAAVQDHIGSLNWGYRVELRDKRVDYLNALGEFVDAHTVQLTMRNKETRRLTARRFVVAVGGRPRPLAVPGARELTLSSDDLFSMDRAPGKTLVVGASYVALECAGFLAGLGYDATVMARSVFLRGYDQQLADMVAAYMAEHAGVRFVRPAQPTRFERAAGGDGNRIVAHWRHDSGEEASAEFDTVLVAVGRDADTPGLHLERAGVAVETGAGAGGKIRAVHDRTSVPHIYAIGDVLLDRLELTPVAIKAGRLLAQRLYGGRRTTMDYAAVPTTVFTPLEYGACGLSEEAAVARFGADNVEVYHTYFKPLEWTISHRPDNVCYAKLVCNRADSDRIVGFHVLGPNAGEITQGYAVALKAGATKAVFDQTVGIHPTSAEEFTTLKVTKASGLDAKKNGC